MLLCILLYFSIYCYIIIYYTIILLCTILYNYIYYYIIIYTITLLYAIIFIRNNQTIIYLNTEGVNF